MKRSIFPTFSPQRAALLAAAVLGWPGAAPAHDIHYTGRATAVNGLITVNSTTKSSRFVDVPMSCSGTAREEHVSTVTQPAPLGVRATTLDAYAIGRDNVAATRSGVEDLRLELPGMQVDATALQSHAESTCDEAAMRVTPTAGSDVGSLRVNGQGHAITGQPNQTIPLPGLGKVVVNEQTPNGTREIIVTALHVVVDNPSLKAKGDVWIAQSRAKVTCSR